MWPSLLCYLVPLTPKYPQHPTLEHPQPILPLRVRNQGQFNTCNYLGGRDADDGIIIQRTLHKLDEEKFLCTYPPATTTTSSSAIAFVQTTSVCGALCLQQRWSASDTQWSVVMMRVWT
jgi:hypothetical protein